MKSLAMPCRRDILIISITWNASLSILDCIVETEAEAEESSLHIEYWEYYGW
jgi:hypothetical protein